MDMFKVKFK